MHEAQAVVLRLLRFSPGPARHPNPAPRRTCPPRPVLKPSSSPGNLPRLREFGCKPTDSLAEWRRKLANEPKIFKNSLQIPLDCPPKVRHGKLGTVLHRR